MGEGAGRGPRRGPGNDRRVCRRGAGAGTAPPDVRRTLRQVTSLHTLGPAGTNCELSARRWFADRGRHGEVVLYPTLEDAASGAAVTVGAALLAPVAYPELHTLMYSHLADLFLADTLVMATHRMVLARRPGTGVPASVASHPAPVALVGEGTAVALVASNSQAASDCAAGLVDACITTQAAMERLHLELVRDFGAVSMAFTVHVRTADHATPSAYRLVPPVAHYDQRGSSDA